MRAERVRFLGGVFDCPCVQAAELGRSCGAMPPCPFAQWFKDTYIGVTTIVYNPAFLFVIGGGTCRMPLGDDHPEKPLRLSESGVGGTSALVRCTRGVKDMLHWKVFRNGHLQQGRIVLGPGEAEGGKHEVVEAVDSPALVVRGHGQAGQGHQAE